MKIIINLLLFISFICDSLSFLTFTGSAPPNIYKVNTPTLNDNITSNLNWTISTTDLDIIYFSHGSPLGYNQTNLLCSCSNTPSPETLQYTTTLIG
jgi:hypothetical protein